MLWRDILQNINLLKEERRMSFNSLIFIFVFLPCFLVGYFLLGKIDKSSLGAKIWVVLASILFYGYANPIYIVFFMSSIAINLFVVLAMHKYEMVKTPLLALGIVLNVSGLLYFKYCNFFIETYNALFTKQVEMLNILVPLGISFFTFKQIYWVREMHRCGKEKFSLIDYLVYITFFPQITSGPIADYSEMSVTLEQKETYRLQVANLSDGVFLFFIGLAKKVLVANELSEIVSACFVERVEPNSTLALMGVFAYSLQIYFDFSGYSDMANGIGNMMNFPTVKNFDSPYRAVSITDFWKRWHISLTKFLTKNVYIPLGGNRKGYLRTYINILVVFLVSGLWHGASWTFVLWGGLHGVLMALDRIKKDHLGNIRLPRIIATPITFIVVSFLWLVFRAENLGQIKTTMMEILSFKFGPLSDGVTNVFGTKLLTYLLTQYNMTSMLGALPFVFIIFCYALTLWKSNSDQMAAKKTYAQGGIAVLLAVLAIASIVSFANVTSFIYWNF